MTNIEGGIQDENILVGSGCTHFSWWDVGWFYNLLWDSFIIYNDNFIAACGI